MTKAAWIGASLGSCLAAALLGCNPLVQRAREVETGFIGMEVRTLRRCLGDAPFFEINEDGSELWAYSAPLKEKQADIEITRAVGSGTANQRPRVEAGAPIERKPILTARDAEENKVPPGSCVYLFTLRDGAVSGYRSRGRNKQDMRADESCTVALQRCIPSAPARPSGSD
jgi:hypothetical protein